ncbi:MAG: RNA polymerase sporulation sigma factor SigH [Eubacteriales bacterium]
MPNEYINKPAGSPENGVKLDKKAYLLGYKLMKDEDVAFLANDGDGLALEYLLNKYKNFAKAKAKSYFIIGADKEDIVQEGMIGLYKAIRDFKEGKQCCFRAFAELCITRQIITAIKSATRQKHIFLNSYVSLSKPVYDEESDKTLMDLIPTARAQDPEEIFIDKENFDHMEVKIDGMLSPLEKRVLACYLEGKSYIEISSELGKSIKSVDNALQRIKAKLEKFL